MNERRFDICATHEFSCFPRSSDFDFLRLCQEEVSGPNELYTTLDCWNCGVFYSEEWSMIYRPASGGMNL